MKFIKNTSSGYTLVEILVSVAIITIITSVVLWNQSRASNRVLLANAVNETAVFIREAQVFGVGVRVVEDGGGDTFDVAYGVYGELDGDYIILFADKNGDGLYSGTDACVTGANEECLEKFEYNAVTITDICGEHNGGSTRCTDSAATEAFVATFIRPSPQGTLSFLNNGGNPIGSLTNEFLQIKLSSRDATCRVVTLYGIGQIATNEVC